MSPEVFQRIVTLKTMQVHLTSLREKLEELEVKDFVHLDHAERLVLELLADPGCDDFNAKAISLNWNIQFIFAEYQAFLRDNGLLDELDVQGEFFGGEE